MNYEALSPRGTPEPIKLIPLASRLSDLNNKTVYVVNIGKTYADEILAAIGKLLSERFPRANVVQRSKRQWFALDEPALWKEVREKADAAIVAPKD